jgi:hypothetical protein
MKDHSKKAIYEKIRPIAFLVGNFPLRVARQCGMCRVFGFWHGIL